MCNGNDVKEQNARAVERLQQLEQARREYLQEKGDAVRVRLPRRVGQVGAGRLLGRRWSVSGVLLS